MSGTSHPGLPFNPYKGWLGIDVTGRKPTHYELLGLEFGVVDAATAKASVLERSAKVRHYQAGKHADLAAQVLDELAEAQLVLTNAERKKEYDKKFPIVSVTLVTQEKELAPTPSPFDNPSSEKKSRAFSRKISNPPKKKTEYRIPPALAIVILVLTVIGHVTLGLGTYAWLMGGSDPKRNEVKNERPAVVQSQPVMESKLSQSGDRKEHQEIRYKLKTIPQEAKTSIDPQMGTILENGSERTIILKNGIDPKTVRLKTECPDYEPHEMQLGIKQNSSLEITLNPEKTLVTSLKWIQMDSVGGQNIWKDEKGDAYLKIHPFPDQKPAIGEFELNGFRHFETTVKMLMKPASEVQFAIMGDGNILWQSKIFTDTNQIDQCALDVTGIRRIALMTRCSGSFFDTHSLWKNSLLTKAPVSSDNKPTIDPSEQQQLLAAWKISPLKSSSPAMAQEKAIQKVKFIETLQLMEKEVPYRNTKIKVRTALSTFYRNKETANVLNQQGWKVEKTIGYLSSEQSFGGPHDIKDKDMIFLTSRVDPKLHNTQYLLSNQFNLQTDHIVVFIGWVFTRRIPGTIPVAIRRNPGIGNTFTHALLVGDDAIRSNKNIQLTGTFFIYEKDPNLSQGEAVSSTPTSNMARFNNPKPFDIKPNEPPPTEKSTDSFDAKALAAGGQAIFSLFREKNGHPEAYFTGNIVENT